MDPGYCQDLTGWPYGLPIVLQERLTCDDASVIHQFTDAGHDALALEEIARTVAHRQIGVTARGHVGVLARADQALPASELVRELAAHG
jgi:predicted nucleic acid-binding protein